MSLNATIPTLDGDASFGAYVAQPAGSARGAIIVIQEIFGVNAYVRSVVDQYASFGYRAIAPALFDRGERGVELWIASTQAAIQAKRKFGVDVFQIVAASTFYFNSMSVRQAPHVGNFDR
mgnify:CR=1 FL=1